MDPFSRLWDIFYARKWRSLDQLTADHMPPQPENWPNPAEIARSKELFNSWNGLSPLRASFAVPFSFGKRHEIFARLIYGRFNERQISGNGIIESIHPTRGEPTTSALPEILAPYDALGDFDIIYPLSRPFQLPIAAIHLQVDEVDISELVGIDEQRSRWVSYSALHDLEDLLLRMGSDLLQAALDSNHLDDADGSSIGPLSAGDLVGCGIIEVRDWTGELVHFPLVPLPQLGAWGVHSPSPDWSPLRDQEAPSLDFASDHLRRVSVWRLRYQRHRNRGEWAEAVVALEASLEQYLWFQLELILIEHGFSREDILDEAKHMNASLVIAHLQHHIGGSAHLWREIMERKFGVIWSTRNQAIHAAAEISLRDLENCASLERSVREFIEQRLIKSTFGHYIGRALIEGHQSRELALFLQVANGIDLRDFNTKRPTIFPKDPRAGLSECSHRKARKLMTDEIARIDALK